MHGSNGYAERNGFVHIPRYVHTWAFGRDAECIVVATCAKSDGQHIGGMHGQLHLVEAAAALNSYFAIDCEVKFYPSRRFFRVDDRSERAFFDLRIGQSLKKIVTNLVVKLLIISLQLLGGYLKLAQCIHSAHYMPKCSAKLRFFSNKRKCAHTFCSEMLHLADYQPNRTTYSSLCSW
jgi:hypothetical protein